MSLTLSSEFLGHACTTTTQVYAYIDTEMKPQAIEKIYPQSSIDVEVPMRRYLKIAL